MNSMARAAAAHEIELLRRRYALATDLIGKGGEAEIAAGTQIYEAIFSADVAIRTVSPDGQGYQATGPVEWAGVVSGALDEYCATQHLIGTQLVDFQQLDVDGQGGVVGGEATLLSYLHAWHARPDGVTYVFIGTYEDRVEFFPERGWRIVNMVLTETSSEKRRMGTLE